LHKKDAKSLKLPCFEETTAKKKREIGEREKRGDEKKCVIRAGEGGQRQKHYLKL